MSRIYRLRLTHKREGIPKLIRNDTEQMLSKITHKNSNRVLTPKSLPSIERQPRQYQNNNNNKQEKEENFSLTSDLRPDIHHIVLPCIKTASTRKITTPPSTPTYTKETNFHSSIPYSNISLRSSTSIIKPQLPPIFLPSKRQFPHNGSVDRDILRRAYDRALSDARSRLLTHDPYSLVRTNATNEVNGNPEAKRLLHELMKDYNRNVLPVPSINQRVNVTLGLKLSQLSDIDERNQIMTTNVWLEHEWNDYKLTWIPSQYDGIDVVEIPSSDIWVPDIVLYNNADGTYEVNTITKAHVFWNGTIKWNPPVIYKSYCAIDIEYYPFDVQNCTLKFGTWSHDGNLVDLNHKSGQIVVAVGVDLTDYYPSIEWDILSAGAVRHVVLYDCCQDDPYFDVTFALLIRRKPLFYTVNLVIPCVNIAFLTILVFYLPSDCGEKLTLSISIFVALQVFYLLLVDLIPPTSIKLSLLGTYLLFTLVLVNASIFITIITLNIHWRHPNTHHMPAWVKRWFFEIIPPLIFMSKPRIASAILRPTTNTEEDESILLNNTTTTTNNTTNLHKLNRYLKTISIDKYPPTIQQAIKDIRYISETQREAQQDDLEREGWRFIALVIDRCCLIVFIFLTTIGSCLTLLTAPSMHTKADPIERQYSRHYNTHSS
ncbi:unnamed protein product [Adineta steineri]|uniref:Uncharacterized protein n=1 Tax=Adineta steineri TaxID=433720 RepID=A0A813SX84_9BILA|nr:unnamed protein product [Adineta steineri]CAF3620848.1 unnamed protein product [Adineta steineri]